MVYKNAPHGLFITEKEKLNADLISFITENISKFESEKKSISIN